MFTNTPTPRHPDTPTPRHPDTPTPRHPDTPTPRNRFRFTFGSLLLFVILLFVLQSCQKDEKTIVKSESIQVGKESMEKSLAKAIAMALEIQEVRDFLKNNTYYDRFGEPIILYSAVKDKPIDNIDNLSRSGGNTLADILTSVAGLDSTDAEFFRTTIVQEKPMMAIYVVSGDQEYDPLAWDTSTEIPMVLGDPFDGNDFQEAYDSNLNVHLVNEDHVDVAGNPLLLVYETSEIAAIDAEVLSTLNDVSLFHLVNSRTGTPCTPEGEDELCDSFRASIQVLLDNMPPDMQDINGVERWVMLVTDLVDAYTDLCCDEDTGGGNNPPTTCFDSGNNYDRDSRDFIDETTGINISRRERKKFCAYKRDCSYRMILATRIYDSGGSLITLEPGLFHTMKLDRSKHYNDHLWYTIPEDQRPDWRQWRLCEWDSVRVFSIIGVNPRAGEENTYSITIPVSENNPVAITLSTKISENDRNLGTHLLIYSENATGPDSLGTWYNNGQIRLRYRERFN